MADSAATDERMFRIRGMDCPGCAATITKAVRRLHGVTSAEVDFMSEEMTVRFAPAHAHVESVLSEVEELGYGIAEQARDGLACHTGEHGAPDEKRSLRERATSYATMTSAALWIGGLAAALFGASDVTRPLFGAAILIGGVTIAVDALRAVRRLRLDINVLMTIAVIGAVAIGEWGEAATVVVLFAISEMLEVYSMDRARNAIQALMSVMPQEVTVRRNGALLRIPVEQAEIGEVALVRPGERVPLDGVVTSGRTTVNEAPITGESRPVEKEKGSTVFAGSVNDTGAFEFSITKHAGDTTFARILELVRKAQASRAPAQRFIERFAAYYTPAIFGIAVLMTAIPVLLFGQPFEPWFYRSLVVLVVGCPCALVLSTPVSVVSGLARAASSGILIKGGAYLEALGRVRAIAFDKTGTLTEGRPHVSEVIPFGAVTEDELLQLAASVESHSEHAIAGAIVEEARKRSLPFDDGEKEFTAFPGRGGTVTIEGTEYFVGNRRLFEERGVSCDPYEARVAPIEESGKTVVFIGTADTVLGCVALDDRVRPESAEVLDELRHLGIEHVTMLTGDRSTTAARIAGEIGLDRVEADLLPADKVARVEEMNREHGSVVMVGDGINDAPSLAAATIGVAMGAGGTETALEAADIALMSDDLWKLPLGIRLSRRTLRVIQQNIAIALGTKIAVLILAGFSLVTLWMAVLADVGVSLVVVVNGLRLLCATRAGKES